MNVHHINSRLLFDFPAKQTDIAILFGNRSISGSIVDEAVDLYSQGAFQSIILTGGLSVLEPLVLAALTPNFSGAVNSIANKVVLPALGKEPTPRLQFTRMSDFLSPLSECDYMKQRLLEKGVPESAIIFEDDTSKNTGQNVERIQSSLKDFRSATLLTTAYFSRRAIGTIRQHSDLDHLKLVAAPVYPFGFTRDNWHKTAIKGLVSAENDKMTEGHPKSYIGEFCVDPDIDAEIEKSSDLPDLAV